MPRFIAELEIDVEADTLADAERIADELGDNLSESYDSIRAVVSSARVAS